MTDLYILAAQLYHVVYNNGGTALFVNLEKLYQDYYGTPLKLSSFQIFSIDEFYFDFDLMFFIKGSKKKGVVVLNRNLAGKLEAFVVLYFGYYLNFFFFRKLYTSAAIYVQVQ